MRVRFVFIGEGSSDSGLLPKLEELCLRHGATEVAGVWPELGSAPMPPGRDLESQVRAALEREPGVDLVFIHRDADAPDPEPRRKQLEVTLSSLRMEQPHVLVVPVQELEAWLLLDEVAIRRVAGNPGGRVPLSLPPLRLVERTSDPKKILADALLAASEATGRARKKQQRRFPELRAQLLTRLDLDGPVRELAAWRRLEAELKAALEMVAQRVGG